MSQTPPVVCIPSALTPAERERAAALRRTLAASADAPREIAGGCAFRFRADLRDAAEWIALERRCCPFLSFELRWAHDEPIPSLALTGPEGTRDFLAREMLSGS